MATAADRELKKGNAELLILALLEDQAHHGYEIGKLSVKPASLKQESGMSYLGMD